MLRQVGPAIAEDTLWNEGSCLVGKADLWLMRLSCVEADIGRRRLGTGREAVSCVSEIELAGSADGGAVR